MEEFEGFIEAKRCLSCKIPKCQTGCPTGMQIRDFIKKIKENDLKGAAEIIRSCSSLSTICSVVCPHEKQCVGHCLLNFKKQPINIGRLEQFVFDNYKYEEIKENVCHKKVAIVGMGPAGIACALELAIKGCKVTMFDAEPFFGGVLSYGIPNFRLELARVKALEEKLKALNVEMKFNQKLLEEDIISLKDDFDDVFIGIGLTNVRKLGIPHEDADGVFDALKFLKKANYFFKYNYGEYNKLQGTTVVVGAGNVAMDASRMALRCGSNKVIVVYRRSLDEAPANKIEITEAQEEGVEFRFLNNPVEIIIQDNHVIGIKCEVMSLGEVDESGRRSPIGTGEFITIPCNNIISAIGQIPDKIFINKFAQNKNYLVCDDVKTSIPHFYAGGDIVLGAQTVVKAQLCGRKAAQQILNN